MTYVRTFAAIGTICHVLSTDPDNTVAAAAITKRQLDELDRACSRFRPDSELAQLPHGRTASISPLLTELLAAAVRTARRTEGVVDPTVGAAMRRLGYDADLAVVRSRSATPLDLDSAPERAAGVEGQPAPGYWRILLDQHANEVVIPHGVEIDLGASAKAWAADRAAQTCRAELAGGFLVNLGGDIAVAGAPPPGGWQVAVDDATESDHERWPVVSIYGGGLATSSTAVRTWQYSGRRIHHIVDPRTGEVAEPVWRATTVVARNAELANAAATAAIVLGEDAPLWLARRGLVARLVRESGQPTYVGDWPVVPVGRQHSA